MHTYPTHTNIHAQTHSSHLSQLNWSSDLKLTSIRHFSVFNEMHFTRSMCMYVGNSKLITKNEERKKGRQREKKRNLDPFYVEMCFFLHCLISDTHRHTPQAQGLDIHFCWLAKEIRYQFKPGHFEFVKGKWFFSPLFWAKKLTHTLTSKGKKERKQCKSQIKIGQKMRKWVHFENIHLFAHNEMNACAAQYPDLNWWISHPKEIFTQVRGPSVYVKFGRCIPFKYCCHQS